MGCAQSRIPSRKPERPGGATVADAHEKGFEKEKHVIKSLNNADVRSLMKKAALAIASGKGEELKFINEGKYAEHATDHQRAIFETLWKNAVAKKVYKEGETPNDSLGQEALREMIADFNDGCASAGSSLNTYVFDMYWAQYCVLFLVLGMSKAAIESHKDKMAKLVRKDYGKKKSSQLFQIFDQAVIPNDVANNWIAECTTDGKSAEMKGSVDKLFSDTDMANALGRTRPAAFLRQIMPVMREIMDAYFTSVKK